MGRLTEIIAALNKEAPLDKEHFSHLDVDNPKTRKEILDGRKERKKPRTLFDDQKEGDAL